VLASLTAVNNQPLTIITIITIIAIITIITIITIMTIITIITVITIMISYHANFQFDHYHHYPPSSP